MKTTDLEAQKREVGSRVSRRLRRNGRLPVNLYGHGEAPLPLSLDTKAFDDAIRGHARVFHLSFDGHKESAVIHEVQHDTLSNGILHIDFQRVNLSEKVEVSVPVRIMGPSAGELAGGVLQEIHDHVKLRCLPLNIPEEVVADVRELAVGKSFHISDFQLPDGIEAVEDPNMVVLSITEPRFTETAEPSEEEGGAEAPKP